MGAGPITCRHKNVCEGLERNKRNGREWHTGTGVGTPTCSFYSDTLGVTNIKGHSTDNTNKGARTLSYGPVCVVLYLSYCTYSQQYTTQVHLRCLNI